MQQNSLQIKIFLGVIGFLVLGIIAMILIRSNAIPAGPGKYDVFAQCLKDQGAVFYGAFWCTHCQAQKKLFGSSVRLLSYVECSNAAGTAQLPVCAEKNIASYPTWEFADGSRLTGEIPLVTLAEKTSCALPLE